MSFTEPFTKTVDALRASPALLVLVLLQVGTLGMIYFSVERAQDRQHAMEMAMIERCFTK